MYAEGDAENHCVCSHRSLENTIAHNWKASIYSVNHLLFTATLFCVLNQSLICSRRDIFFSASRPILIILNNFERQYMSGLQRAIFATDALVIFSQKIFESEYNSF